MKRRGVPQKRIPMHASHSEELFSLSSLLLSVVLIRLAAKGHGMQHPRCRRRSHLFIDVLNIARA